MIRHFSGKFLTGILTESGYKVIHSENGKEGIERVKKEQPDLIITDLLMPVHDGYWVLEQLNARGCTTPVIIVTSDIQKTTESAAGILVSSAFMNKPVEKNQVISTVKDALKRL